MRKAELQPLIEDRSISVPQLAVLAGLSRNAVYEAVKRGEIQATRVGRRIVIPAHVSREILGLKPASLGLGMTDPAEPVAA